MNNQENVGDVVITTEDNFGDEYRCHPQSWYESAYTHDCKKGSFTTSDTSPILENGDTKMVTAGSNMTLDMIFTGEQQLEIFKMMESAETESELQKSLIYYFITIEEYLNNMECDPSYMSYAVAHALKENMVWRNDY
jgi:hypothetical protein